MEKDNTHFNKLFWFCVGCVAVGLTFLIALCFVPVPKGSERFADNCQGFFQGSIVAAAITFLLGGNIPVKKVPTVAQTGDNPQTTIIQPASDKDLNTQL